MVQYFMTKPMVEKTFAALNDPRGSLTAEQELQRCFPATHS